MLLFLDSADHYGDSQTGNKYTTPGNSSIIAAGGRRGTNCLRTGNFGVYKTVPPRNTYIVGGAVKLTAYNTYLFVLLEGTTWHFEVKVTSGGLLQVSRNGTTIATGSTVLSLGVYYYIEFKVFINDSTGSYTVRLNENVELTATGVDTKNGLTGLVDNVAFYGGYDIDDIYICDTNGTKNNDFLGDIKVEAIFPSADNTPKQWIPSTGSSNYAMVDETAPNSDTDYVTTSGTNYDDVYDFQDLTSVSGTVLAIQLATFDRKTDAGGVNINHLLKIGGIIYTGIVFAQQDTYTYHMGIHETNPGTGTDWTITDVNSASFGIRRL